MSRSGCLAAVVAVVSAATSLAGEAPATNAAARIAEGDAALTNFDLPKATLAYRAALQLDPANYDAGWRLARALVDAATLETDDAKKKALLTEAQDHARAAVRSNPDGAKGHTFLAIVVGKLALYHGGRTKVELSKEVKVEAERAIALDPNEDLAYHVLGIWNREMVELNWFLKKFAEVLYGKFPPASMDAALTNLRKAAELSPATIPHQVELGLTLKSAGKAAEAKQTLERALTMPKTWVTDDAYRTQAQEAVNSLR
jgi:tetratricopeptide (TPR) repeat protein